MSRCCGRFLLHVVNPRHPSCGQYGGGDSCRSAGPSDPAAADLIGLHAHRGQGLPSITDRDDGWRDSPLQQNLPQQRLIGVALQSLYEIFAENILVAKRRAPIASSAVAEPGHSLRKHSR